MTTTTHDAARRILREAAIPLSDTEGAAADVTAIVDRI